MTDFVTIPEMISARKVGDPSEPSERGLVVECVSAGQASDGYHTFDELYEHRHLLLLSFLRLHGGWRSRKHSDGSEWDGWFIGTNIAGGAPISYHLPERLWDLARFLTTEEFAPEWDGHTSHDVCDRLREALQ
jgi:hypothetical protein